MVKIAKDVKENKKSMDGNEAIGNFWEEVENLERFEKKKEVFSYATNCNPYGTIGCC